LPTRIPGGSIDAVTAPDGFIQDQLRDNFCFGCGAANPDGLQLKSRWADDLVVADWTPHPEHAAGPRHILNGGIIATLLDCHGVGTAISDAFRREDRTMSTDPEIWYATASMTVEYLRPAPIEGPVHLTATVVAAADRRTTIECELAADGKPRARATVEAVRVPDSWRHGGAPA
jgi:acyl-coenzyme A thioesterase PaaI-like protein